MICIREENQLVRFFDRKSGTCERTFRSNVGDKLLVDSLNRLVVVSTDGHVKVLGDGDGYEGSDEQNGKVIQEFELDAQDCTVPNQFISITDRNELAFILNWRQAKFYKLS